MLVLVLAAVGAASAQKSFYNQEFKVGFKYPATMKPRVAQSVADDGFKNLGEVSLLKTRRRVYNAAATLSAGSMTEQACTGFANDPDEKRQRFKFGTVTYEEIQWTDGGMESETPQEFYRIYRGGVCYQLKLWAIVGRHPLGDEKSAMSQLRALLSTLYFSK
jgi:hypothetical protein